VVAGMNIIMYTVTGA